jgi:hypothetical protein
VWAIVDDERVEPVEIIAWGTGWEVPDELMNCGYLGTESDEWGYVWHYFWDKVESASATAYVDDTIYTTTTALAASGNSSTAKSITSYDLATIENINDYQVYSSVKDWDKADLSINIDATKATDGINSIAEALDALCGTVNYNAYH